MAKRGTTWADLSAPAQITSQVSLLELAKAVTIGYEPSTCHTDLSKALEQVETGDVRRLGVAFPPQHGKTTLASICFALWALARNPSRRIVLTAYSADRAEYVSGQAREITKSDFFREQFPNLKLDTKSSAQSLWRFEGYQGYVKAVGQGGPLTGFGADILIIDDPIKDRVAADSELQREALWDWYRSVAYTRLSPDGAVVVIQTRWHEDDLLGRLLHQEGGDQWQMLHFPAVSEDGAPLWPEKFKLADYERIKRAVGPREWEALYMGRPAPPEGGMIKSKWFTAMDSYQFSLMTKDLPWVRYWDLAYTTKTSSDYTVGVKLALCPLTGTLYVGDIVRMRAEWPQVREKIVETAKEDGEACLCAVEKNGTQVTMVQELQADSRMLGIPVIGAKIDGDKVTRAWAWAGRAAQAGITMRRAVWNEDFVDECVKFPLAKHDDQVDGVSGAFRTCIENFMNDYANQQAVVREYTPDWFALLALDQGQKSKRKGFNPQDFYAPITPIQA